MAFYDARIRMRDDAHAPERTDPRLGGALRLALAGVLLAACAVVAWTWRTWPDVVSDSGRELYVAWRLSAGQVLYRDVAYFNGPLSPYLNAAWFAAAGPGLSVLEIANGLVALSIGLLTWRFLRRLAGPAEAIAGLALFAIVLVTGPLTRIGSFSYLIPYSHELTHGLLLLLVLLLLLERALVRGGAGAWAAAGIVLGLCLLTKPEIAIAAAATTAVALVAGRGTARQGAIAAAAAAVAPLGAWIALARAMPPRDALAGILGSWTHLTDPRLTSMPYFRLFLGSDRPLANFAALLAWSAVWVGIGAAAVAVARLGTGGGRRASAIGATAALVVAAAAVAARDLVPWYEIFRPLPLFAAIVLVRAARKAWRAREAPERNAAALVAAAAAGSLALTLKMILYARIWHYGFALGMPAAMLALAATGVAVKRASAARGASPVAAGGVLVGALAGTIAAHLFVMAPIVRARDVPVGAGRDAFLADARGAVVADALAAVARDSGDGATLAVLPDGVMISYLARRPNSTPYVIGNPADVLIFGEERMLAAYRTRPPDLVALTRCDTTIYGYPEGFGRDYARALRAWIAENYEPAEMIGGTTADADFRVALLRRKGLRPTP